MAPITMKVSVYLKLALVTFVVLKEPGWMADLRLPHHQLQARQGSAELPDRQRAPSGEQPVADGGDEQSADPLAWFRRAVESARL